MSTIIKILDCEEEWDTYFEEYQKVYGKLYPSEYNTRQFDPQSVFLGLFINGEFKAGFRTIFHHHDWEKSPLKEYHKRFNAYLSAKGVNTYSKDKARFLFELYLTEESKRYLDQLDIKNKGYGEATSLFKVDKSVEQRHIAELSLATQALYIMNTNEEVSLYFILQEKVAAWYNHLLQTKAITSNLITINAPEINYTLCQCNGENPNTDVWPKVVKPLLHFNPQHKLVSNEI